MSEEQLKLIEELKTDPAILKSNQAEHLDKLAMDGEVFIAMPSEGNVSMELMNSYIRLIKPKHYFHSTNMIPLDKARNALVADFLVKTPKATHILFWDDDIVPPPDALLRLWLLDEPIVSGLYFQKGPPFHPLMALKIKNPDGQEGYTHLIHWEEGKKYNVDGIGMGFALIRRDVFQDIDWPPFSWYETDFSEDYAFCTKCRNAGYKIKVDTGVLLTHLANRYPVGYNDFKEHHDNLVMKQITFGDANV